MSNDLSFFFCSIFKAMGAAKLVFTGLILKPRVVYLRTYTVTGDNKNG